MHTSRLSIYHSRFYRANDQLELSPICGIRRDCRGIESVHLVTHVSMRCKYSSKEYDHLLFRKKAFSKATFQDYFAWLWFMHAANSMPRSGRVASFATTGWRIYINTFRLKQKILCGSIICFTAFNIQFLLATIFPGHNDNCIHSVTQFCWAAVVYVSWVVNSQ